MKQLDRDKHELEGQLRDLEWRLDKESKVTESLRIQLSPVGWQQFEAPSLAGSNYCRPTGGGCICRPHNPCQ